MKQLHPFWGPRCASGSQIPGRDPSHVWGPNPFQSPSYLWVPSSPWGQICLESNPSVGHQTFEWLKPPVGPKCVSGSSLCLWESNPSWAPKPLKHPNPFWGSHLLQVPKLPVVFNCILESKLFLWVPNSELLQGPRPSER